MATATHFGITDLTIMKEVIEKVMHVTGEDAASVIASFDDVHGIYSGTQIRQLYDLFGVGEEE